MDAHVKTEFKITAHAPYQIVWKSLAYSQDLAGHLKISRKPNADTHSSTTQKPLRVFAKKSRSRCAHFDFGVRSPTPQFQCCYLRTDLAYKNRLFFRTASALVKHKPINIEIGGAGVDNAR